MSLKNAPALANLVVPLYHFAFDNILLFGADLKTEFGRAKHEPAGSQPPAFIARYDGCLTNPRPQRCPVGGRCGFQRSDSRPTCSSDAAFPMIVLHASAVCAAPYTEETP